MPTGTVGAISELVVCSDLLKKGYHVFRSVSPSCPCDLAIVKGGELLRVEVTTGSITPTGRVMCSKKKEEFGEKYDILAVVIGEKITYQGL